MLSTATIKHKNLCLCTWWERMQCFREADSELRGVGRAGSMGVSGGSPQQCLHSRLATLRGRRHYESLSTGNVNTKQKHCFYHLTHRGFSHGPGAFLQPFLEPSIPQAGKLASCLTESLDVTAGIPSFLEKDLSLSSSRILSASVDMNHKSCFLLWLSQEHLYMCQMLGFGVGELSTCTPYPCSGLVRKALWPKF